MKLEKKNHTESGNQDPERLMSHVYMWASNLIFVHVNQIPTEDRKSKHHHQEP